MEVEVFLDTYRNEVVERVVAEDYTAQSIDEDDLLNYIHEKGYTLFDVIPAEYYDDLIEQYLEEDDRFERYTFNADDIATR